MKEGVQSCQDGQNTGYPDWVLCIVRAMLSLANLVPKDVRDKGIRFLTSFEGTPFNPFETFNYTDVQL